MLSGRLSAARVVGAAVVVVVVVRLVVVLAAMLSRDRPGPYRDLVLEGAAAAVVDVAAVVVRVAADEDEADGSA